MTEEYVTDEHVVPSAVAGVGVGVVNEPVMTEPTEELPDKRSVVLPLLILMGLIGYGLKDYHWEKRWQEWRGTYKYSCPKFADGFREQFGKGVRVETIDDWPDFNVRESFICFVSEDQKGRVGLVQVETAALGPFLDKLVAPKGARPLNFGVAGEGYVYPGLFDGEIRTAKLPARASTLVWRCQDRRMTVTMYDYTRKGKRTNIEAFGREHVGLLDCDGPPRASLGALPEPLDAKQPVAVDTTTDEKSCPGVTGEMVRVLSGDRDLKSFELRFRQANADYECELYRLDDSGAEEIASLEIKLYGPNVPDPTQRLASYREDASDEFSLPIPGNGFIMARETEEAAVWVCEKGRAEVSIRRRKNGSTVTAALRVLPSLTDRLGCA